MTSPSKPITRLQQLTADIVNIARSVKRDPASIQVVAVSKGQSVEAIETLIEQGQLSFGENYLQEALPKIMILKYSSLIWHFIGHVQHNKAKLIAAHFDWVHSVDSLKVAQALNHNRIANKSKLNVCIQVNLYGEASKGGVTPTALADILTYAATLPNLRLRGLMTVLPQQVDPLEGYTALAKLQQHYQEQGFILDTLSMGMSGDYPAAIAAGATWLRIGTALFGARNRTL